MKKAFTLIEVSILLVIFIMVAVLVIPLSIDDTIQARNIVKWKHAISSFNGLPIKLKNTNDISEKEVISIISKLHPINKQISYKIKYMNGKPSKEEFTYNKIYLTDMGAAVAFKIYKTPLLDKKSKKIYGTIMYDVNGKHAPNVWGKDVFGMNIYEDSILPFGFDVDKDEIEFDCSKHGSGLYCSTYYTQGGTF